MPNSPPASTIEYSLAAIDQALIAISDAGVSESKLSTTRSILDELIGAFRELPDEIADAETKYCEECAYLLREESAEGYAVVSCEAPNAMQCPQVQACGWMPIGGVIPKFLQRQAE